MKKTAFTLAEVLIMLGIIGVVAAMTIPTLMNATQDKEFKTAWKKEFSALSQALAQMANDNGGSIEGAFSTSAEIRDKFAGYLIKSKLCDDSYSESCWSVDSKFWNGTTNVMATGPAIIMNDGALILFQLSSSACTQGMGTPVAFYRCGGAAIELNGLKKPNIFGKDIFEIHILKDRILPYGTQGDGWPDSTTDCKSTGTGESCSAKYLYD